MANLIQGPYLHSSKWSFFKHQNNLTSQMGIFNSFIDGNKEMDSAYQMLLQEKNIAEARELAFFRDFDGINGFHPTGMILADARQWTQCFLIKRGQGSSKISELQKILQSNELYRLFGHRNAQALLNQIKSAFSNQKGSEKIIKKLEALEAKAVESLSLGDILNQIGFFNSNNKTNLNQTTILNNIIKSLGSTVAKENFDDLKITGRLTSKNGRIKEIERIIKKHMQGGDGGNIANCLSYIETEMRKKGIFTEEEIKETLVMWKELAYQNYTAIATGMIKASGEAEEISRVISLSDIYIKIPSGEGEIDESFFVAGHQSLAKRTGAETVKRYSSKNEWTGGHQSKIDTAIRGKSGQVYNFQEKNTISNLFDSFIEKGDLSKLPTHPGSMKLAEETKFSTIQKYFSLPINGGSPLLDPDELNFLTYLMVNVNLLNIWSHDSNDKNSRLKKGGKETAAVSKALIDTLITRGIRAFIGDFIFKEEGQFNTAEIKNWDFIIYRGEILFPLSVILQQMLNYISTLEVGMAAIRTTHGYEGDIGVARLKQLREDKLAALGDEGADPDKNYENENLVAIGSELGAQAVSGLYIKNIKIMFNQKAVRNLLAPEVMLK